MPAVIDAAMLMPLPYAAAAIADDADAGAMPLSLHTLPLILHAATLSAPDIIDVSLPPAAASATLAALRCRFFRLPLAFSRRDAAIDYADAAIDATMPDMSPMLVSCHMPLRHYFDAAFLLLIIFRCHDDIDIADMPLAAYCRFSAATP